MRKASEENESLSLNEHYDKME